MNIRVTKSLQHKLSLCCLPVFTTTDVVFGGVGPTNQTWYIAVVSEGGGIICHI